MVIHMVFGKIKGIPPIPAFFGGVVDYTFSGMIVKDKHANLMVESHMEGGTLIPV